MFHEFKDDEEKGIALIFDTPKQLLETASKVIPCIMPPKFDYPGRKASNWNDVMEFIKTPWPEAERMIQSVLNQIDRKDLPIPKSVKRKRTWNEDSGEVSVDRALGGDSMLFQEARRQSTNSPTTVTILANLETATRTKLGVYWRSATAIAVIDILEELGYSCELWVWCAGQNVYRGDYPNQFTAALLKEAGDPLNISSMCDTLSEWFTIYGIFNTFAAAKSASTRSLGGGRLRIGKWIKHLQTSGAMKVQIPIVFSPSRAIEAVKTVLDQVINWKVGNDDGF